MTNHVRTRTLGESGAWVEADKPTERLPKTRRFLLIEAPAPEGIIAEGVCWADGGVALRFHGDRRATVLYDNVDDVIAGNSGELSWVD